ncbi:DUF3299 domain-containing protein [Litorivicinus lipolyticus]|uniref:DUF3299 domain-containing protein n=1 Tax=Litorivicinus lipolyticus TaxID=418701 RepID=UPI003B59251C
MIKSVGAIALLFSALGASASWFSSDDPIRLDDARLKQSYASWDGLIPPDAYAWVPENPSFELIDSDEFQRQLEASGASLNEGMQGKAIGIGGFMVPIDVEGQQVLTFLLVPEAGQCVHVPAPPINQTVLVDASLNPVLLRDLYQPIWVNGDIRVSRGDTDLAEYGYLLVDPRVYDLEIPDYDAALVPRHSGD